MMKSLNVRISVLLALCLLLSSINVFAETADYVSSKNGDVTRLPSASFPDVPVDALSSDMIMQFRDRGFTTGYPDGTFRPQASVTRSEFVTFVNRTFGFTETASMTTGAAIAFGRDKLETPPVPASQIQLPFTDVTKTAWYASQVQIAYREAYLNGYPDKTFRPLKPITRQEAAAVINRLLQLKQQNPVTVKDSLPVWAETDIRALVDHGIMTLDDGWFRCEALMTREEMAVSLMTVVLKQESEAYVDALEAPLLDVPATGSGNTAGTGVTPTAAVLEALEGTHDRLSRVLNRETVFAQALDEPQRAIVRDIQAAIGSYLQNYEYDYDTASDAVRVQYRALTDPEKVALRNAISASVPLIWLNELDRFFRGE
jgi:hypothetical protein